MKFNALRGQYFRRSEDFFSKRAIFLKSMMNHCFFPETSAGFRAEPLARKYERFQSKRRSTSVPLAREELLTEFCPERDFPHPPDLRSAFDPE